MTTSGFDHIDDVSQILMLIIESVVAQILVESVVDSLVEEVSQNSEIENLLGEMVDTISKPEQHLPAGYLGDDDAVIAGLMNDMVDQVEHQSSIDEHDIIIQVNVLHYAHTFISGASNDDA